MADEPFEPPVGQGASQLANVTAAIPLGRAALAQLCEDAEGAMTFGRRTLAELGGGAWMLESITRGYLALDEWLRGCLAEAKRALSSAIAQARTAGAATMAAWVCHHLGLVQRPGPPGALTSRRWRSTRRPAGQPGPRRAWPMWAWMRWPIGGTTWTRPCGT